MTIMLILLGATVVLELLVHIFGRSRAFRRVFAVATLLAIGFTTGVLIAGYSNVFTIIITILSLYRMFNMIRVVRERMHERYLRNATRTTSWSLLAMQTGAAAGWWVWHTWHTDGFTSWGIVAGAQAIVALVLLLSVLRTLRKTAWPAAETPLSDRELPTVTIAIPARNETEDLQRCLESVIASDYPKLEVIVLDDCSQIKRTPEIIKQFAHDGVRFIQGHEPEDTWLPKNQAYARLAEEASGAYILFCGVDVRFGQQSVRRLITTMHTRQKQMMCILPRRQASAYGHLSLIQAMRYWWELVPPRRSFSRPPVISSSWIITRAALKRTGGFAAVSRSVMPEAHFAKSLIASDGYSFLRSTDGLDILSNKPVVEQRDTAIRMRYPQMHRRPEQVALLTLLELMFLLAPFALTLVGFWVDIGSLAHILAAMASVLLTIVYELSALSTRVNSWWFGLIGQPLAALTDIFLLHYSMSKYEFSIVDWKGRNVCIPVMHVVPKLPDAR
jgi:hypothetical protein